MYRILPWSVVLFCFMHLISPGLVYAQETAESDPQNERLLDLETGVREIGLAAGYATQCLQVNGDEDAAQAVGDEALAVAELILQDFGSTLAFLFTANAGYGAGDPVDEDQCEQYIRDWNETVDAFFVELEPSTKEAAE